MNEANYVPDIGRGEPFGFKISNSSHEDRTYVGVPGNVCDNPQCSCRELGLAIYDYPEEGQDLADHPVYNFVLDLTARAPREDNDTDQKSLEFAHVFLEHCREDQWPLFEQAFVYLKEQAILQKNILQGKAPGHPADSVTPVGRNERCPCGSGKKYKHCHGA